MSRRPILYVTGDRFDVRFLLPQKLPGVMSSRTFAGGACGLAEFARGVAEASGQAYDVREDASLRRPGRGHLVMTHHVEQEKPKKPHAKANYVITDSGRTSAAEYIAPDCLWQAAPATSRALPAGTKPGVCLVRNASIPGLPAKTGCAATTVVRLSTNIVPETDMASPRKGVRLPACTNWIEIINLSQVARLAPVAINSSYEAIVRDLLRYFRMTAVPATCQPGTTLDAFCPRMHHKKEPPERICVVVRINETTAFLYLLGKPDADGKRPENCALVYCPELAAPLDRGIKVREAGTGTLLAACLALHCAGGPGGKRAAWDDASLLENLIEGVTTGIKAARRSAQIGLSFLDPETSSASPLREWVLACLQADEEKAPPVVVKLATTDMEQAHSVHTSWLIQDIRSAAWVKQQCGASDVKDLPAALLAGQAEVRERAMQHVHRVGIGKSWLVDRSEVEDYLALLRVLRSYADLSNPKEPKPLNFSVFGAPGSGKSFGVKELVKHCSANKMGFSTERILEFNMSQFTSVSDLAEALHEVRDRCMSGEIPVAFFDEFDSAFAGAPFGWFKYLLMPMQDARFWDKNKQFSLGRCVLVFAGGINRSFQELHGRMRNDEFVTAKGPDFISRLRGYLNIRPITYSDAARDRTRLRRAIVLHDMLVRRHADAKKSLPDGPLLDAGAAWAMLEVTGFRHGVRSLEAVLHMSDFEPGQTLTASRLPDGEQIDMHVDAKAWAKAIREGPGELKWLK